MATAVEQQVLVAVANYQEATRRLRIILEETEAGLDTFATLALREHAPVSGTLLRAEASTRRQEFSAAMADFEATRRQLRIAMLRLGLERGETLSVLAHAVGISRQLASRLLTAGE